jgi:hypothetical protein
MNRRSVGLWAVACLVITLSFVSSMASAADSFILISDVDDTVKISDVKDPSPRLLSESVFAGMPELYRQILGKGSSAQRLQFLSCSPYIVKHHVNEILHDSKFPDYIMTIPSPKKLLLNDNDCYKFKFNHMKKIYNNSPNNFLLIGDDTQKDPEVYEVYKEFANKDNTKVLATYIHRIKGDTVLPTGSLPFVTAYDIALHEFLAHRLSEQQAAAVGNAVLDSSKHTFLPRFQACPAEYETIPALPDSLATLKAKIETRLASVCESRKKK